MKTVNGVQVLEETDPVKNFPAHTRTIRSQIPSFEIKVIAAGTNLNDIMTSGTYHQPLTANAVLWLNYPTNSASAGLLEVVNYSNFTYQRYTTYSSNTRVYIRGRYNTAWNSWILITS